MSVPKTSVKYGKYSSLKLRQEVCAILPQQGASGQAWTVGAQLPGSQS